MNYRNTNTALDDVLIKLMAAAINFHIPHFYCNPGSAFMETHRLSEEIYKHCFEEYDTLAEIALAAGYCVPVGTLMFSGMNTHGIDSTEFNGVLALEDLIKAVTQLSEFSGAATIKEWSNQELITLNKFKWLVECTTEE